MMFLGAALLSAGCWLLPWGWTIPFLLSQMPAAVWVAALLARLSEQIDWDWRPIRSHRETRPAPVADVAPLAEVVSLTGHRDRETRKAA